MKIQKKPSSIPTLTMKIGAIAALPFTFFIRLFAIGMDVLIDIPVMNAVWRERRELETLTDYHIKDIGLNKITLHQEIKRTYFDIPPERRPSCRRFKNFRYN